MALTPQWRPSGKALKRFLCSSAASIKAGDLVMLLADGYAYSGAVDDNSPETTDAVFAGVATEDAISAGVDGDVSVKIDIGGAHVLVTQEDGSQAQTNIGDGCSLGTSATSVVGSPGGDDVVVGKISEIVDADTVWVACKPLGVVA